MEGLIVDLEKKFFRFVLHEVNNSLNKSHLADEAEKFLKEAAERDKREQMEKRQEGEHP